MDDTGTDRRKKPCVWNGIEYESLSAAAKANGVAQSTMGTRIAKGYIRDGNIKIGPGAYTVPCEWNGVDHHAIVDAAKHNRVYYNKMHWRIRTGKTSDKDLSTDCNPIPCEWEGKEYPSIIEAARDNEINFSSLRNWIHAGFTSAEDIDKRHFWDGRWYRTYEQIAEKEGVSVQTVRYWIKKGCQSRKESYRRMIRINGVEYGTQRIAAKSLGVSHQAISSVANKYGNDLLYYEDRIHTQRRWFPNEEQSE